VLTKQDEPAVSGINGIEWDAVEIASQFMEFWIHFDRSNTTLCLPGVALFDSRIEQTHSKLNDVFERQERCDILENELQSSKVKLEKECEKAKKYKELKSKLFQSP
jgi:hypothetical protein